MPGSVLPGCREELKLSPFSIPSRCPLQMTGVKETNRHCCSPRVFSRELTQAHSPLWHGTELTERWYAGGRHSRGCGAEIHPPFQHGGPGCWLPGEVASSQHAPPSSNPTTQAHSFGLTGMKIIFKKITPLCIPNPELLALFCLTGKDKETTTPQWPRLT